MLPRKSDDTTKVHVAVNEIGSRKTTISRWKSGLCLPVEAECERLHTTMLLGRVEAAISLPASQPGKSSHFRGLQQRPRVLRASRPVEPAKREKAPNAR
jgi:hypothetical protein